MIACILFLWNYTFVRKLHNRSRMEALEAKKIHRKIKAYNLKDSLLERLNIVIVDGVAPTTMYKAFRVGGTTPLLENILDVAQMLILEHEEKIRQRITALMAPAEA